MKSVESVFQRLESALPLAVAVNVRFLKVASGLVLASVIRTMRLPKSWSATIVFAPERLPTLGGVFGIWTILRSLLEQLYAGGPQVPAAETRTERLCCAECEAASATRTLKVKVPAWVADPESVPLPAISCRPAGSEPEAMLH